VQKLTRLTGPATKKPRPAFLQIIHDLYLCIPICHFLSSIFFTLIIRKSDSVCFFAAGFLIGIVPRLFVGLGALEPATFPKIDFLVAVFRGCITPYNQ